MIPCTGERFLLVTFYVSGIAGFAVCLSTVFSDVCPVSGLDVGGMILGHGNTNIVEVSWR